MGLEPMTSPLPRECSTTELHQPSTATATSTLPRSHPCQHNPEREKTQQHPTQLLELTRLHRPPHQHRKQCHHNQRNDQPPIARGSHIHLKSLATTISNEPTTKMVHRVGFEPTYSIRGQIYSLLPLTARPPVPCAAFAFLQPPSTPRNRPRENLARTSLRLWMANTAGWNFKQVQPTSATTNSSCCPRILELAKGFEPPTA
jgi:hypothetical protein